MPLSDLIISRRVSNGLHDYRVLNLTVAALMREEIFTSVTPPGRKVRFVVVGREREIPKIVSEYVPRLPGKVLR